MAETQTLVHPIPPLFDAQSRVLILGSFPSVKSREAQFFYGHPHAGDPATQLCGQDLLQRRDLFSPVSKIHPAADRHPRA